MLDKFHRPTKADKRRISRRAKRVCGCYTGRAIAILIICALIVWCMCIQVARGEDVEVYLPDSRPTVTDLWQTIHPDKDATITVWFEHPDPMELGDDISFYCTFEGCHRDNFNYTWQYSGDGTYWTNFGSKPRKNTTYSDMLAGQQIRLVVKTD